MRRAALLLALVTVVVGTAAALPPKSRSADLMWGQVVSWSPDGQWVVSGVQQVGNGLIMARSDGSGLNDLNNVLSSPATWSPNGRRIATYGVVVTPSDGSVNRFDSSNGFIGSVAWSPDSEWLVYAGDNRSPIRVVRWNGSERRTLVTAGVDPSWSADGQEIAYGSSYGSNCQNEIRVVRSDGTGDQTLASGPEGRWGPVWSPNGERLAYKGYCNDSIYVVGRNGAGERVVGHSSGYSFGSKVAWSPDGRWLGFVSQEGTVTLVEVDGPGACRSRRVSTQS